MNRRELLSEFKQISVSMADDIARGKIRLSITEDDPENPSEIYSDSRMTLSIPEDIPHGVFIVQIIRVGATIGETEVVHTYLFENPPPVTYDEPKHEPVVIPSGGSDVDRLISYMKEKDTLHSSQMKMVMDENSKLTDRVIAESEKSGTKQIEFVLEMQKSQIKSFGEMAASFSSEIKKINDSKPVLTKESKGVEITKSIFSGLRDVVETVITKAPDAIDKMVQARGKIVGGGQSNV